MIKEFEPPFLYKTPSIIEEKIKRASTNLLEYKFAFFVIFIIFNGFFIGSYIYNKNLLFLETLFLCLGIFSIFFYFELFNS